MADDPPGMQTRNQPAGQFPDAHYQLWNPVEAVRHGFENPNSRKRKGVEYDSGSDGEDKGGSGNETLAKKKPNIPSEGRNKINIFAPFDSAELSLFDNKNSSPSIGPDAPLPSQEQLSKELQDVAAMLIHKWPSARSAHYWISGMLTEELHCNERFKRSLEHALNRDAQLLDPTDTTKRKLVDEEIQSLSGRSIVRVAAGLRCYYRPNHDPYLAAMLRAELPRDEWPDDLFDGTTHKRPKATLARHDQDSPESGLVQQQGKRHIEFDDSRGDPYGPRDSHDRKLAYHKFALLLARNSPRVNREGVVQHNSRYIEWQEPPWLRACVPQLCIPFGRLPPMLAEFESIAVGYRDQQAKRPDASTPAISKYGQLRGFRGVPFFDLE
ncbi:hypothetical protein HDK77DRAFT_429949 [Phyllosticta capitalensis]